MPDPRRIRHVATNVALSAAFFAAAGGAIAQDGQSSESRVYQQRTADGRIVLTDRPVPGAVTQRTWQAATADAAAARQRREEARLEGLAVNERVQRQIEAERQRDHELALARMQLAEAEARLDAERARTEAAARTGVIFVLRPFPRPPRVPRPWPSRPPLPMQPGFGMFGASN